MSGGSRSALASAFAKMFSGTLVSRILGMVRAVILVAALGSAFQADAFNLANTLPNTFYNLLAGGVLNAILVPQIVRAMRRPDGDAYTNKLLTISGTLLFGATVLLTACSAIIITIYASQLPGQWFGLAVAFTLWCMPEVFFYGLYALFGNVLNARGSFGPYMWAPVVNNVVSIAGLVIYLVVFGGAATGSGTDPSHWTAGRTALVGGTALAGVVCQALVLIIPLRRSGFRFRLDFNFKGAGLGGASRMAMWTFAALAVGQVSYIFLSNVAASATAQAEILRAAGDAGWQSIPTLTSYTNAFMTYMLPQSLVTTSLVTALFTTMSARAAEGRASAVRDEMSFGVRTIGVFSLFASAAFAVLAIPLIQTIFVTASEPAAIAYASVLAILALGIPAQAIWTIAQRVFYAYEDAKTLFMIQLPMAAVGVLIPLLGWLLLPPHWWVPSAAAGVAVSMYVGGVTGFVGMRTKLPNLDGGRILRTYLRLMLAIVPATLAGWGLLHFWGPVEHAAGILGFLGSFARLVVVGGIMAAIYLGLALSFGVTEVRQLFRAITRRVRPGGGTRDPHPPHALPPTDPRMGTTVGGDERIPDVQGRVFAQRFRVEREDGTTPAGAALWSGRDLIMDRGVQILSVERSTHAALADAMLDAARRASLIEDPRFARILSIGDDPTTGTAIVIAEEPAGRTLASLAGTIPPDTARAIVGETAAALEAARHRGVQHGALTDQLIYVSDSGVVISGLGYLAAACDATPPTDPLDASLGRTRADAAALESMYLSLSPDAAGIAGGLASGGAVSAGAVMRALSPWGAIQLPPPPPAAPPAEPSWSPLGRSRTGASAPSAPSAGAVAAPPPLPPVDTSAWTLHPPVGGAEPAPDFSDLLTPADDVEDRAPIRAANVLPAWKVLLPPPAESGVEAPGVNMPPPPPPASVPDAWPVASGTPASGLPEGADVSAVDGTLGASTDGAGDSESPVDDPTASPAVALGAGESETDPAASPAVALGAGESETDPAAVGLPPVIPPVILPSETDGPDAGDPALPLAASPAQPGPTPADTVPAGALPPAPAGAVPPLPGGAVPPLPGGAVPPTSPLSPVPPTSPDPDERAPWVSGAVAAGSTAAAKVRQGAATALQGTAAVAEKGRERLDSFAERRNLRIPGQLEGEENAALPPSRRRIDPGPFIMLFVLAGVVLATVLALGNLTSVQRPDLRGASDYPILTPDEKGAAPIAPPEETTEQAPEASGAVPTIAGVNVLDPQGDGAENQDLAPRAWDGDPSSYWRSRSYVDPAYGMKSGIGLEIVLAEPATVTEITLTLMGNGGHVQVLADPASALDPNRVVLAEADMGPTTVLTLSAPTELSSVTLWFTHLPVADSDGKNRVELTEIAVH